MQCPRIDRWSPIAFESARRTNRSDEHGFSKEHAIQYAQIGTSVTMTVEQNGCLLANETGDRRHRRARPGSLDQILNSFTPTMISHYFHQITLARVNRFIGTEAPGQSSFHFIRITDK